MTVRVLITCLILFLNILGNPALAAPAIDAVSESIVRVQAYDNNRVASEGAGFVINETGHVLTHAHLVRGADRVTVISIGSGAEIAGRQMFTDREMNLAVLVVPGLELPPLSLSEQGADVGRIVRTLSFADNNELRLSQGTVGAYQDHPGRGSGAAAIQLLLHNAMITAAEFGMPLFNECGQVVAVNLPDPDTVNRLFRRVKDPENVVYGLRAGDIIAGLNEWEVPHTAVEDACLSAVARAEQSAREKTAQAEAAEAGKQAAEQARQQAESEKQSAEEAKQQAEAARQQAEAARQQAEADKQSAEEAKQQAETARQQLEAEKQATEATLQLKEEEVEATMEEKDAADAAKRQAEVEAEAARQEQQASEKLLQRGALVGSVLIVLALLGWFVASRSKKRSLTDAAARVQEAEDEAQAARQVAAAAPQPAPFKCLLEGRDESGQPFALSIPALALGDPAGVVIGRNPANAEFVINHGGISREHIRLVCAGGDLQVEDLGTTNGTRVNERQLSPGVKTLLRDLDQLEIGPVRLTVRLL